MTKMDAEQKRESFTGLEFSRKPRRSVVFTDKLARWLITFSGIGSIAAVMLVGLFLLWVVLPLFQGTELERLPGPDRTGAQGAVPFAPALHQVIDDYGTLIWSLHRDGAIRVRDPQTRAVLDIQWIQPDGQMTAWATAGSEGRGVAGYADGSIVSFKVDFESTYIEDDDTAEFAVLKAGQSQISGRGVVTRTPEGQLRRQLMTLETDARVELGASPIRAVEVGETTSGLIVVALDQDLRLHDRRITWRKNLLTGQLRVKTRGSDLDPGILDINPDNPPTRLALNDSGDIVLMISDDGDALMLRRNPDQDLVPAERHDLVPEPGVSVGSVAFLAGRTSLAVGDDAGGLRIWFPVRGRTLGDYAMAPAHDLSRGNTPITSLAASGRSRMLIAGLADGRIELFLVTTERFLGEIRMGEFPITTLAISPREDLLLATDKSGVSLWRMEAGYPEIDFDALWRPIWYEGYQAPAYVWQSSAASDTFEPKLSLMPLVFGTLKATFYSMLFGLPIALLAALYTSEFLNKKSRTRIKPVIEIMASLPSVVLGFLAALVIAPMVEKSIVPVVSVLFCSPVFFLLGAHLWQLLPRLIGARLEQHRPVAVLLFILVGVAVSLRLSPGIEDLAFGGDAKAWLDGRVGSGLTGWFLLLLLPSAMLVGWLNLIHGESLLRSRSDSWSHLQLGLLDLLRFGLGVASTILLALGLGWLLITTGWDPRGSVLDTYVQRNALVVGFAMGFAVIPIIYSVAEDALSAVPDHLRAAALGAGATPWQTAIMVIVPPAISGLFSAVMIGLGRAVGETMIVLMAAGNTPIMDMNIFNGFRTLAANLAVELPEAVQGSGHYRTLFMAALVLFVMTFVLNTVAEIVRLHFRRKSSRL